MNNITIVSRGLKQLCMCIYNYTSRQWIFGLLLYNMFWTLNDICNTVIYIYIYKMIIVSGQRIQSEIDHILREKLPTAPNLMQIPRIVKGFTLTRSYKYMYSFENI